ncbi:MAG TPA: hypothetical protein VFR23_24625 [Jiangellaceae bacterium]|nr:hypothetical protein [Jiangellaceae bacterium]
MAITVGTVTNWGIATLNPAAQAVTLAAGTKIYWVPCGLVHISGASFTTMALGGVAMTAGASNIAGENDAYQYYTVAPTTGATTLDWALSGRDDGPVVNGVEVLADGSAEVVATNAGTTSAAVASNTGDLVLACAFSLDEDPGIGGTGASSVDTFSFSNLFCNVFTLTAGASSTTGTASGIEPKIVIASFRESGGGGGGTSDPGFSASRTNMIRNAIYRMAKRGELYVPARLAA